MAMSAPHRFSTIGASLDHVVTTLCAAEFLPRLPGTEGGLRARALVEASFRDLGLEPAGEDGYLQPIPAIGGANVIGRLPGRSAKRSIIVGAHFDACAIDGGINPGASDNASGVAVLIEVARMLANSSPARDIVFVGFDAEEPPYYQRPEMGSRHFVAHSPIPVESIDLMICLDMVGHPVGRDEPPEIADTMLVYGAEKSREVKSVLTSLPVTPGLVPRQLDAGLIDQVSDYAAFEDSGIPFLFYSCGRSTHYHHTTDTPDTLDYGKMEALVHHLTGVIAAGADVDSFTFDAEGTDPEASIATLRALAPTLPATSRLARQIQPLLYDLEARAATNELRSGDRNLLRRIFLAIEQGLSDDRLWCNEEAGL